MMAGDRGELLCPLLYLFSSFICSGIKENDKEGTFREFPQGGSEDFKPLLISLPELNSIAKEEDMDKQDSCGPLVRRQPEIFRPPERLQPLGTAGHVAYLLRLKSRWENAILII